MNHFHSQLLDEAILLELSIADLYLLFSERINYDHEFWFRLAVEEKNHAALLRTGKDMLKFNQFPVTLLPDSVDALKEAIKEIKEFSLEFKKRPDRIRAFEIAYYIENSIGEVHYNEFMAKESNEQLQQIFRKLNKADVDHVQRIKSYWEGILLENQTIEKKYNSSNPDK